MTTSFYFHSPFFIVFNCFYPHLSAHCLASVFFHLRFLIVFNRFYLHLSAHCSAFVFVICVVVGFQGCWLALFSFCSLVLSFTCRVSGWRCCLHVLSPPVCVVSKVGALRLWSAFLWCQCVVEAWRLALLVILFLFSHVMMGLKGLCLTLCHLGHAADVVFALVSVLWSFWVVLLASCLRRFLFRGTCKVGALDPWSAFYLDVTNID